MARFGDKEGLIELYNELLGSPPGLILQSPISFIKDKLLEAVVRIPAISIVAQAGIEEIAAIGVSPLPFVDPRKGFYEDRFISDHGGLQNVTVTYSNDGKFKILSADRSLVEETRRRDYKNVNSHPDKDIIVIPN